YPNRYRTGSGASLRYVAARPKAVDLWAPPQSISSANTKPFRRDAPGPIRNPSQAWGTSGRLFFFGGHDAGFRDTLVRDTPSHLPLRPVPHIHQPLPAIASTGFGEELVDDLRRVVLAVEDELDEAAGFGGHGGLSELEGVHLAQA